MVHDKNSVHLLAEVYGDMGMKNERPESYLKVAFIQIGTRISFQKNSYESFIYRNNRKNTEDRYWNCNLQNARNIIQTSELKKKIPE